MDQLIPPIIENGPPKKKSSDSKVDSNRNDITICDQVSSSIYPEYVDEKVTIHSLKSSYDVQKENIDQENDKKIVSQDAKLSTSTSNDAYAIQPPGTSNNTINDSGKKLINLVEESTGVEKYNDVCNANVQINPQKYPHKMITTTLADRAKLDSNASFNSNIINSSNISLPYTIGDGKSGLNPIPSSTNNQQKDVKSTNLQKCLSSQTKVFQSTTEISSISQEEKSKIERSHKTPTEICFPSMSSLSASVKETSSSHEQFTVPNIDTPLLNRSQTIKSKVLPHLKSDSKNCSASPAMVVSPYLQPTDTSIFDARQRLKVALDQTRMLREAFTNRVYQKYRLVLRPVERSVENIIDPIVIAPQTIKIELTRLAKIKKYEKESEANETQKLYAEMIVSNNSTKRGIVAPGIMNSMENREQLSWFGAGLNLVILPEEEIDPTMLKLRGVKHRGPIDPNTGNRVGGISAAAAVAANAMLDRVRKCAKIRVSRGLHINKESKHMQSISPIDTISKKIISESVLLGQSPSSNITHKHSYKKPKKTVVARSPNHVHKNNLKESKQISPVGFNKKTKRKFPSAATLLSISPNAETVIFKGKITAAMAALISCGANIITSGSHSGDISPTSTKTNPQIYPQSRTAGINTLHNNIIGHHERSLDPIAKAQYLKLVALPPIMLPNKRRKMNTKEAVTKEQYTHNGAKVAINALLNLFFAPIVRSCDSNNNKKLKGKKNSNKLKVRTMKRGITEIGLLNGLRHTQLNTNLSSTSSSQLNDNETLDENNAKKENKLNTLNEEAFDPLVVFAVLHALGYISESVDNFSNKSSQCCEVISLLQKSGSKFTHHSKDKINSVSNTTDEIYCSSEEGKEIEKQVVVKRETFSESMGLHWITQLKEVHTVQDDSLNDAVEKNLRESRPIVEKNVVSNIQNSNPVDESSGNNIHNDVKSDIDNVLNVDNPLNELSENKIHDDGNSNTDIPDNVTPCIERGKKCNDESSKSKSNEISDPIKIDSESSIILDLKNNRTPSKRTTSTKDIPSSIPDSDSDSNKRLKRSSNGSNLNSCRPLQNHHQQTGEIASLWGDQGIGDVSALHPQLSTSMLPSQIASTLDGFYPFMTQHIGRPDSSGSNYFQSSPASESSLPFTQRSCHLAPSQLQGQAHCHDLSQDRFNPHTNASTTAVAQQLHLAQNTLQHVAAAAALKRSSSRVSQVCAEMGDYFGNTPGYNIDCISDWATLGSPSGLLSSRSLNAASMGLTPQQAAAMVSLSVQDRAAQALLVQEQQTHAAAVHAHAHAHAQAAHRNATAMVMGNSRMSPQQAMAYLNATTTTHTGMPAYNPTIPNIIDMTTSIKQRAGIIANLLQESGSLMQQPTSSILWPSMHRQLPPTRRNLSPVGSRSQVNFDADSAKKDNLSSPRLNSDACSRVQESNFTEQKKCATKEKLNRTSFNEASSVKSKILQLDTLETLSKKENHLNFSKTSSESITSNPFVGKTKGEAIKSDHPILKLPDKQLSAQIMNDKKDTPRKEVISEVEFVAQNSEPTLSLNYITPQIPNTITSKEADLIMQGLFYKTVTNNDERNSTVAHNMVLLEYLVAVGTVIPIPDKFLVNTLNERLNTLTCKTIISGLSNGITSLAVPREMLKYVVSVWLWVNYKNSFERAFAKDGRIDIDPECIWLVNVTIDLAVASLLAEATENIRVGRSFRQDSKENKKLMEGKKLSLQPGVVAIRIATLVSRKLMLHLCLDSDMDAVLPNVEKMVNHIDDLRMRALRVRCQERALLATLISNWTNMSEVFSHSYTSSVIRAGNALGYEHLCDIVQDEETATSSFMPFDILNDSTGAWEEPCRPFSGFIGGVNSDELKRRAHGRALMHMSLKNLQDQHKIEGGTPNAGPYSDRISSFEEGGGINSFYSKNTIPKASPLFPKNSIGTKRKLGLSGCLDTSGVPSGISSLKSTALFNPNHHSSPFLWNHNRIENTPYGRHAFFEEKSQATNGKRGKILGKKSNAKSVGLESYEINMATENGFDKIMQSTQQIEWSQVAQMFQTVSVVNKKTVPCHVTQPVIKGATIFAPFCHKINENVFLNTSDHESDSDEDISDDYILANHQQVLDDMKKKLDAILKIRRQVQERSRNRSGGRLNVMKAL